MKPNQRIALVTSGVIATAGLAVYLNVHRAPEERPPGWHPHFSGLKVVDAGNEKTSIYAGVVSKNQHIHQSIDCTNCAAELLALQQALNVEVGLGVMLDGGYVSTPAPSYYLDGGIAYLPDGGYYAPIIDEEVAHPHPTEPNRYRFDILDRDQDSVSRLLRLGIGPHLPSPSSTLDSSWQGQPTPQ